MTDTAPRPYVLAADVGVRDLWFPSNPQQPGRYRIKVAGEQSDGRLAQVHMIEARGAAAPVHLHRDADETIFVIDGELDVFIGDERTKAGPGDFLFVPRGAVHTWLVRSAQVEALLTLAPAGLEGFFAEVGAPVSDPVPRPMDVDPEAMNERAGAYGVEVLGPPPTLD